MTQHDADNTWTVDALTRGDTDAIRARVFEDPSYVHERDYLNDTPLLSVIAFDDHDLVRFLIEHGADPNVEVDDGYTCLLTAIESEAAESVQVVAELIEAGADIHARGINGWTPLHMAANRGHVEKARLLIDAGADVNCRTEIDALETPLMEAASRGQPGTARLLLEHGADPSMRDTMNNRTPLEIARYAARGPDPDVVKLLKEENIQIDADEVLDDVDLPTDQLERVKQHIEEVDMTQSYIDACNECVEAGNHAEVIRMLTGHYRSASPSIRQRLIGLLSRLRPKP